MKSRSCTDKNEEPLMLLGGGEGGGGGGGEGEGGGGGGGDGGDGGDGGNGGAHDAQVARQPTRSVLRYRPFSVRLLQLAVH